MNEDKQILEKKVNNFKSFYNLCEEENKIDEISLKEHICDVLSWIEICIKSIDENKLTKIEKEIISGIKYANNMKKHSRSLYSFDLNTYPLYPSNNLYPSNSLFPSSFGIFWNDLPLDNKKFYLQHCNYKKHIERKNINLIFDKIFNIINTSM